MSSGAWRRWFVSTAAFSLGAVDVPVVAVAERLQAIQIATLAHRHFRAVTLAHAPAFELVP
jgi:hypothetical protein